MNVTKLALMVMLLVACRSHHATNDASAPLAPPEPETIVEVDTTRLAAYGLTLADVEHALRAQHLQVESRPPSSFAVVVHVSAPTMVLEIVIKVKDGAPVRISDVARLSKEAESD